MKKIKSLYSEIDRHITMWMAANGVRILRVSLGTVFLWFGSLKFFPGLSPAQDLVMRTFDVLSFGMFPGPMALNFLAAWECVIGIGLIAGVFMRAVLLLLFMQMLGTLTPLFLFPHETFLRIPIAPTLEGQYIIKNMVLIGAGIVIGATVRGGAVVADPETARLARMKIGKS